MLFARFYLSVDASNPPLMSMDDNVIVQFITFNQFSCPLKMVFLKKKKKEGREPTLHFNYISNTQFQFSGLFFLPLDLIFFEQVVNCYSFQFSSKIQNEYTSLDEITFEICYHCYEFQFLTRNQNTKVCKNNSTVFCVNADQYSMWYS